MACNVNDRRKRPLLRGLPKDGSKKNSRAWCVGRMAVFTDANDADQNDLFEFDQTTGKIRKVGVLLGHSGEWPTHTLAHVREVGGSIQLGLVRTLANPLFRQESWADSVNSSGWLRSQQVLWPVYHRTPPSACSHLAAESSTCSESPLA